MLVPGHARGHKDSEMPDMWIEQVYDALAGGLERGGVRIDCGQPGQRLMRRRDVVAAGGEDHQRNADALEVNDTGARRVVRVELHLALLKPVADEQVLNGGEDSFTAAETITRPPAIE